MVVPVVAYLMSSQTAISGCGNLNRSDDGVGSGVIQRLQSKSLPAGVSLFDAGTDGMAVMYKAKGMERLIIIDARAPEGEAGAVFEVPGEVLSSLPPHSLNLHDFRWDHALYAGQKIYADDFPTNVKVFLIEAESIDLGTGLSEKVEKAADIVAAKIEELVRTCLEDEAQQV